MAGFFWGDRAGVLAHRILARKLARILARQLATHYEELACSNGCLPSPGSLAALSEWRKRASWEAVIYKDFTKTLIRIL